MALYVYESTMEDSFIYQSFNASNSLVDKLVKYLKTSVALDASYIEEQYSQIKKLVISPLSQKVIQAYDNGDIELLYSRDVKIGMSLPFIIRRNQNGKIVATIFISTFGMIDKNGVLNIPVKQLYALMESAYVALELQRNPTKIQRNVGIMRVCCDVYTEMIMRVLNKQYALTTDRALHDKVSYAVSRFFLEKVWEYPNPSLIESYASINLKYIEPIDLDLVKQGYDSFQIKNINDLLGYIKTLSPRLSELNTRFFIEQYVNMYHGASILSIDYLPYVFFVIINVLLSSFLVSQATLNDLIKNIKGMNRFYPELSKNI